MAPTKKPELVDLDLLAEKCAAEAVVMFTLRLPRFKRDALEQLAKRRYGTSAQRLVAMLVDQLLAEK